jgi:hypothetical protein
MGTSSTERIALLFETRADLSGAEAVRKETSAVAQEATKAARDVAAATQTTAAAEKSLAGAAAGAAVEQEKLTSTVEQTREAWARSGGDMERFKRELLALVTGQQQLAAATKQAGDELARQSGIAARATSQYRSPIGPGFAGVAGSQALGPAGAGPQISGPQLGPAVPGLTTAAAIEASNRALDQVSPKARQAGNALNVLAQAAATGNGSLAGLATAAGNVAQGISVMTDNAKVAASAAGIGAMAAATALFIGLAVEAKRALDAIPVGKLSDAATGHLKNLHTEQEVQQQLALLETRRVTLQSQLQAAGGLFGGKDALTNQKAALDAIVDIDAQREALARRRVEITAEERARTLAGIAIETAAQTTATDRYAAQLRQIEAERLEAIRSHQLTETAANQRAADQRHDLNKAGHDFVLQLDAERAAAEIATTERVFDVRRQAEDARFAAEKRALEDRALSTEAHTRALDNIVARHSAIVALLDNEKSLVSWIASLQNGTESDNLATSVSAKLDLIEVARVKAMQAGVDEVTATRSAEDQKRRLYLETARIVAASLERAGHHRQQQQRADEGDLQLRQEPARDRAGVRGGPATILSLREGGEALAAAGAWRLRRCGAPRCGRDQVRRDGRARGIRGRRRERCRRWRWGGRWRRRRDDVPTARGLGRRQPDDRAPDGQSVQP